MKASKIDLALTESQMEELKAFEEGFAQYEQATAVHKAIASLHEYGVGADSAHCMLLTGDSGAGKSAILREYVKDYPVVREADRDRMPVLVVETPFHATYKTLAEKTLKCLGAPFPSKGTAPSMAARICEYLRIRDVDLLIIDEVHQLHLGSKDRGAYQAAESIKSLLNSKICPMVLVGMEEAEAVVDANPQLRRRCKIIKRLAPLGFGSREERDTFRLILQEAQNNLPFGLKADLINLQMAQRLHYASRGLVGLVFPLLHEASKRAVKAGLTHIDESILSDVWADAATKSSGHVNPFRSVTPPTMAPQTDSTAKTSFRTKGRKRSLNSQLTA